MMDPVLVEQLVSFGVALAVGAILWCMGGMVLRSAIGLAGLIIGALVGWLTWIETGGAFPLWAVLLVFGVVVACVSLLIYRLLLAGLMAGLLSLVIMVTLWSALAGPGEDNAPPAPLVDLSTLVISSEPDAQEASASSTPNGTSSNLLPAAKRQADAIRNELSQRIDHLRSDWKLLDPTRQFIVLGSIVGGILLGLIIATFAVKLSAIVVTAVLGALLILGSLCRLLAMAGAPIHQLIEVWVLLPLVIWAGLSFAGILMQCTVLRRRKDQNPEPS